MRKLGIQSISALLKPALGAVFLLCGVGITCAGPGSEKHWAYRAIEAPELPEGRNPVDYFLHEALEKAGVNQNPEADRYTLLRRVTLDLTGLPPTRGEIAAFVGDSSDEAWSRLIDRLLSSPHYGERWGRHWLDVARYVQGSVKVPGVDRIDLAEPYRDYVVRSFNEDKPYDRFLLEQIAGDLIGSEAESQQESFNRITAPAFLSIGPWFEECTDPNKLRLDIIDEQVSTATRAFLALDFGCARCHDHKFDPIPMRDYYALAGIFRSTRITETFAEEWKDGRPRAVTPLASEEVKRQIADTNARIVDALSQRRAKRKNLLETRVRPRESFETLPGKLDNELLFFEAEDFDGHKNLRTVPGGFNEVIETRKALDQWVKYRVVLPAPGDYTLLVRYAAPVPSPVTLELDLEVQPGKVLERPTYGRQEEDFSWHPIPLRGLEDGSLHIRFLADRHEPFPKLDSFRLVKGILEPDDREWRRQLMEPPHEDTRYFLESDELAAITSLEEKIDELRDSLPEPDLTLLVQDEETPRSLPLHVGGDVYQTQGDPIPRAVPTLADHLIEEEFRISDEESGRIQFAQWLTHPDHPLTARVMMNRLWQWHFGTGLVRTSDDFGKLGAKPTHPALLDWLASEFIRSGWSLKHMHRIILSSATYRASSRSTPANLESDADGTLLSRFPRRRLEAEAIYDGMLTSIGKVPRQEPGSLLDTSRSKDRALYILTSARSPMGLGIEIRKMFPLFGFDESGRPMHRRDTSVTPKQALWWLNNPLPRYYADKLAERLLSDHEGMSQRIEAAYEIVLGRPPEPAAAGAFHSYIEDLTAAGVSEQEAWSRACLGLYSSQAFQHLD